VADSVDLPLDREFVETRKGQAQEQTYPAVQNHKGLPKSLFDLLRRACHRRGIGDAPVGRHRLAGPHRADFLGCIVADRKDEIELRRAGPRELVPTLAAKAIGRKMRKFQLFQRLGPHGSCWLATSAKRNEIRPTLPIQNGFGHDGPRGVSGAEKQNVVAVVQGGDHDYRPAAGLRARMKALANLSST